MNRNIDLVYLWCNGEDPEFKKRKQLFSNPETKSDTQESYGKSRFLDNNELKYSLRSVEMYAHWIHHIYIVTDRQVPRWLDTSNSRITIVDHSEIIPQQLIPTFNSTVIERYIHRIPGLSEYFIYGNDDTFFGSKVSPEFFFTKESIPIVRMLPVNNTLQQTKDDLLALLDKCNFFYKSVINSWMLLQKEWGLKNFLLLELHHNFDAYRKSTYIETYNRYHEYFRDSEYRFRNIHDIQRLIFNMDAVYSGKANLKILPRITRKDKIETILSRKAFESYYCDKSIKAMSIFLLLRSNLFCINDNNLAGTLDNKFEDWMLKILYPYRSNFEL